MCVGLFIAAFAYIATRPTGHPGRGDAPVETIQLQTDDESANSTDQADAGTKQQAQSKTDDDEQQPDNPKFAFYEMLPDSTVIIPQKYYPDDYQADSGAGEENSSSGVTSKTVTTADASASNDTPDANADAVAITQPGPYVIQAGAFSTPDGAQRRKAKLTLLGMEAQVLKTQPDSGSSLYLVRTHSITSNNKLVKFLKRLHDEGIDTLVLHPSG